MATAGKVKLLQGRKPSFLLDQSLKGLPVRERLEHAHWVGDTSWKRWNFGESGVHTEGGNPQVLLSEQREKWGTLGS
jgi:hypothetical protein